MLLRKNQRLDWTLLLWRNIVYHFGRSWHRIHRIYCLYSVVIRVYYKVVQKKCVLKRIILLGDKRRRIVYIRVSPGLIHLDLITRLIWNRHLFCPPCMDTHRVVLYRSNNYLRSTIRSCHDNVNVNNNNRYSDEKNVWCGKIIIKKSMELTIS